MTQPIPTTPATPATPAATPTAPAAATKDPPRATATINRDPVPGNPVSAKPSDAAPANGAPVPAPEAAAPPPPRAPGETANARLEQLRKQNSEKRAREAEREQARQRAEQQAAQALHERQREAARAALAEAQARKIQEEYDAVRENPYAILEKAGVSAKDVLERAKQESDPVYQLAKKVERLEAEKAERERADTEAKRHAEEQRRAHEVAENQKAARTQFVQQAADATRYPTIAAIVGKRPGILLAEANALVQSIFDAAQARGEAPPVLPNEELLAYIENEWTKAGFGASGHTTTANSPAAVSQAANGAPTDLSGAGSTTLTNSAAAQVATMPVDIEKLPEREQKKHWARELKRLSQSRKG